MGMRIGELARRTGVGVSTLRAWESRFRFLEPARSPAGHRLYDEADVQRVGTVLRLLGEGLHLPAAIARVGNGGTGALPEGLGEELLYGQILDAADQGVWVSKDGRTRYTNPRMAEMMGYTCEELLEIPVLEFFGREALPEVKERTSLVRAGGHFRFTVELRRADGSKFLAEITTTALLNPAGRYDGAVSLVDDVTDRTEAECQASLRATLFDSIAEAVAAATPDGKVTYINGAAERLLGWRAADLIGAEGREVLVAADDAVQGARIHNDLAKGVPYSGTLKMARRDGTEFLAHLNCAPAFDGDGKLVGLVAAITDQSAREARDQDTRKRQLQAETVALFGAQVLRQPEVRGRGAARMIAEVVDVTRRLVQAEHAFAIDLLGADEGLRVHVASPRRHDHIVVPAGSTSFSGYVAMVGKVVVHDGRRPDHRFEVANPLDLPPTASAVGAPIFGPAGVLGVLVAVSSSPARFDQRDGDFLQGMANVVGAVLMGRAGAAK